MTRPIREDSTQRQVRRVKYGADQLFRRPSPAAAASSYRNSSVKYVTQGVEWAGNDWYESSVSVVTGMDAANYGGYIEIQADGAWFSIGAPLGPKGSVWTVTLGVLEQPGGGRLALDWQTTNVDGTMAGCTATPQPESVDGPGTNSTTWYLPNSAQTYEYDSYRATNEYLIDSQYSRIQVTGDDGAMLSADGVLTSTTCYTYTTRGMNGGGDGSVMWWLRLRGNGRHASATGPYRIRLFYVGIVRHEMYTGYQIG